MESLGQDCFNWYVRKKESGFQVSALGGRVAGGVFTNVGDAEGV